MCLLIVITRILAYWRVYKEELSFTFNHLKVQCQCLLLFFSVNIYFKQGYEQGDGTCIWFPDFFIPLKSANIYDSSLSVASHSQKKISLLVLADDFNLYMRSSDLILFTSKNFFSKATFWRKFSAHLGEFESSIFV